jgi:uncharacterized membrane protein
MGLVGVARDQVFGLVGKVAAHTGESVNPQTVTIGCSLDEAQQFWRDPERLSVVLGDVATIEVDDVGRYRWRFLQGPAEGQAWDSELVPEDDGLRFVGSAADDPKQFAVSFQTAPHDLGVEVTVDVKAPAATLLSGALAFKILYRARALIQTGEVPTLEFNPSARPAAR